VQCALGHASKVASTFLWKTFRRTSICKCLKNIFALLSANATGCFEMFLSVPASALRLRLALEIDVMMIIASLKILRLIFLMDCVARNVNTSYNVFIMVKTLLKNRL
jgi:hypothetical protein